MGNEMEQSRRCCLDYRNTVKEMVQIQFLEQQGINMNDVSDDQFHELLVADYRKIKQAIVIHEEKSEIAMASSLRFSFATSFSAIGGGGSPEEMGRSSLISIAME